MISPLAYGFAVRTVFYIFYVFPESCMARSPEVIDLTFMQIQR